MNWIKKLFNTKEEKLNKRFSIEHYPLTGRYYPRYGNYYLNTNYSTGIIELTEYDLFVYADYSKTEKGAIEIINLFKEQYLKANVKTIPFNNNQKPKTNEK